MTKKVVTTKQMREIDRITIEERGVSGLELMERAGRAVADSIMEEEAPKSVGVVAGKGNNAGDGFVVARLLAQRDVRVSVLMLGETERLSTEASENYSRMPEQVEVFETGRMRQMRELFGDCNVIVDAILGTGVSGPVKGALGEAIAELNNLDAVVVSIDVPSGLDSDQGIAEGACVIADRTVTIGLPKIGMLTARGPEYCGELVCVDIGFPADLVEDPQIKMQMLEMDDVARSLPRRPYDGHKGTFGSLLVIAGSAGMSGAAYLTTTSGLRSGCGMVYAAFPEKIMDGIEAEIYEAVKFAIPGAHGERLEHEAWGALEPALNKADAIALGPGIGTHEDTARLVDELVCLDTPMVIDADALNCLSEKALFLSNRNAPTVLTPHPGEMGRLLGLSVKEVQADRIGCARRLATEGELVAVLKGAMTVIADPDGNVYINPTGNDGMAKGGMGDVLTGLIGGLLAQGLPALEAACAGVYLHGLAGDLAEEELGARGMAARDVLRALPLALQLGETGSEPGY